MWPSGLQASVIPSLVLGIMTLAAGATALLVMLRSEKKAQQAPQNSPLHSPLSLRSVLTFGLLFLSLTVVSGLGQKFFGAVGLLAVVIIGALASAAASPVLLGGHIYLTAAGPAAPPMLFATLLGPPHTVALP